MKEIQIIFFLMLSVCGEIFAATDGEVGGAEYVCPLTTEILMRHLNSLDQILATDVDKLIDEQNVISEGLEKHLFRMSVDALGLGWYPNADGCSYFQISNYLGTLKSQLAKFKDCKNTNCPKFKSRKRLLKSAVLPWLYDSHQQCVTWVENEFKHVNMVLDSQFCK